MLLECRRGRYIPTAIKVPLRCFTSAILAKRVHIFRMGLLRRHIQEISLRSKLSSQGLNFRNRSSSEGSGDNASHNQHKWPAWLGKAQQLDLAAIGLVDVGIGSLPALRRAGVNAANE
eukprot:TRINITY_DN54216_c0_g1_i1.p1 TRINITY_DN54216_c0_g1~~TRINITY_DN54216_c0_g1_i1.p1  ORF type:complete len:118 (+),score=2.30 TRINITY_DN54216_c0_g1_i1:275-628(+)